MTAALPLFMLLLSLGGVVAFRCTATTVPPAPSPISPLFRYGRTTGWSLASSSSLLDEDDEADDDATTTTTAVLSVNADDLYDTLGLTTEERSVVNVHRTCSRGVVYVTSVLVEGGGSSRRRRRREEDDDVADDGEYDENDEKSSRRRWRREKRRRALPRGMALGSGSGFVVDSMGYVVTNYHVVQRAYEANEAMMRYDKFWYDVMTNATNRMTMMPNLEGAIGDAVRAISGRDAFLNDTSGVLSLPARVYVRFGSNGDGDSTTTGGMASYRICEIIDVVKELDVAVLRILDPPPVLYPLTYGSSSDLLVGQSLLAIGNPFGLDRTITSGLVSALGRSVTGVAGNDIKNCIQTDAAINPGNSGGPLLTLNGKVVGVNTMIITTSGSSAGIGFAVPGDNVKERTDTIIELDKERELRLIKRKGRGWLGVEVATSSLEESLRKRLIGDNPSNADLVGKGAFVTTISVDSPLFRDQDGNSFTGGSINAASLADGSIEIGDRIINVGGSDIANGKEFANEMKQRVEGERITLTVESVEGDKRVVYVALGRLPL